MFAHRRLERKIDAVNAELDVILRHLGIEEVPAPQLAKPIPTVPTGVRQDIGFAEIDELLFQGKKIAAIKRYRELTGAGLKDANDAVELRERQRC